MQSSELDLSSFPVDSLLKHTLHYHITPCHTNCHTSCQTKEFKKKYSLLFSCCVLFSRKNVNEKIYIICAVSSSLMHVCQTVPATRKRRNHQAVSLSCVSCACQFPTSMAVSDTKGLWSARPSTSSSMGDHMFLTTFYSCICSYLLSLKWSGLAYSRIN